MRKLKSNKYYASVILKDLYGILKKYFIVQEFTSVHKITTKEKKLYNEVAKLLEEKE